MHVSSLRLGFSRVRGHQHGNCCRLGHELAQHLRNAFTRCVALASDVLRRNPTNGIAACCARAPTGQAAAAPPSSVTNSRRSFDHLIGAPEQRQRHGEAKSLRGLEVDDQLDLRGLLDWQIGWLFALENAAGVDAGLTERLRKTASIAQQATGRGERPILVD